VLASYCLFPEPVPGTCSRQPFRSPL